MKSEHQLYMDFQRADQAVEELRRIAQETRAVADEQLADALHGVDASWDGENSQSFLQKGQSVQRSINGLADDVDKIAKAIETIATRIYNTEMEAIRIAKERGR